MEPKKLPSDLEYAFHSINREAKQRPFYALAGMLLIGVLIYFAPVAWVLTHFISNIYLVMVIAILISTLLGYITMIVVIWRDL